MSERFDEEASEAARDEAIDRVEGAMSDAWKAAACDAVDYVCRLRAEFTTDAVWAILDRSGTPAPPEPRAMGAIMRMAVRKGLCSSTDKTSKSVRVDCHRRDLRVWQSLKHRPGA